MFVRLALFEFLNCVLMLQNMLEITNSRRTIIWLRRAEMSSECYKKVIKKSLVNRSSRRVSDKKFTNVDCICARQCFTHVITKRKLIFNSVHQLSDNTKQNVYFRGPNSPIPRKSI